MRHSRGVACHQHPEAVQGMFAFFKWVTGSTQYDWMVELKSPLSEAPESFTDNEFDVRYSFQYINSKFTEYEMVWTYIWLLITVLVGAVFCVNLFKFGFSNQWSYEQSCAVVLIIGLILFDNPLFAVVNGEATSEDTKESMQFMHCVAASFFCCGLLFVVLCMFDEMSGSSVRTKSSLRFYLPKLVLLLALWITLLVGYIQVISSDNGHLVFDGPGDQDDHYVLLAFLVIFLAGYLVWIVCAGTVALCHMLSVRVAPQFLFILAVAVVTILISLGIVISWYFVVTTTQFVLLNGQINLFVWTMTLLFCPTKHSNTQNGLRYFEGSITSQDELSSITGNIELDEVSTTENDDAHRGNKELHNDL